MSSWRQPATKLHRGAMAEVPRVSVTDMDGAAFYQNHVATSIPVILANLVATSISNKDWDDEFMLAHCKNERGLPWRAATWET